MKAKERASIDAYLSGMKAKEDGVSKNSNPHNIKQVSLHSQWDHGWEHGKA